jgi:hypothetical protein
MPSEPDADRKILTRALRPTKDCPPIEKFEVCIDGDTIPQDLAMHLESCAYCRTELALLQSFHAAPRDAEEAAAVRMVTDRLPSLRPPVSETVESWWRRIFHAHWLNPVLVGVAGMLIVVAIGVQWGHSRAPRLYAPNQVERDVVRSGTITVVSPSGDVTLAPAQIQWEQVVGAAQYRVSLLEVDHTEFWAAATAEAAIDIPATVRAKFVPLKTVLVHVVALDGSSRKLAESEYVRLRLLQNIHKH